MGLCAGGLLLMTGVDADSSWLHLLAGLSVVGVGTGLANPMVTFAHLGVLPPAQGGLASGINNTARQLGLAVGIAVLGAVLQSHIADQVEQRTDALGSVRRAVTDRIADGDVAGATQVAPAGRARQPARDLRGGVRERAQRAAADLRRARAHRARGGAGAGAHARSLAAGVYDPALRCIVAAVRRLVLAVLLAMGVCAGDAQAQDRYSLVGGCYALKSAATGKFVAKAADGGYRATPAARRRGAAPDAGHRPWPLPP